MDIALKAIAFVLVFGLLVVFHEFGHYIVARWMGVKVLAFSVGFGPVLWARTKGDTEYALRALPLGGYVRMLGDDPTAALENDAQRDPAAFHNKAVWRRMLIVVAGPVFNFILPLVVLFIAALVYDSRLIAAQVGTPIPGGPAALAGLLPGDRILSVAGTEVVSFADLVRAISKRAGKPTALELERAGERLQIAVTPAEVVQAGAAEIGVVDRVGRIQMSPYEQVPTVAIAPDSPAWLAGLRSGDRLRAIGGTAVATWRQAEQALSKAQGSIAVTYTPLAEFSPVARMRAAGAMRGLHQSAERKVQLLLPPLPRGAGAVGILPGHRLVGPVLYGSAEAGLAGLRPGDELLSLDGAAVVGIDAAFDRLKLPFESVLLHPAYRTWSPADRVARLQAVATDRALTVRRQLRASEITTWQSDLAALTAGTQKPVGAWQQWLAHEPTAAAQIARGWLERPGLFRVPVAMGKDERPDFGLELAGLVDMAPPTLIDNPQPVGHALHEAGEQFGRGALLILATTAELFKGNVSVKEVGGVIRMAQLTSEAADRGLERVLQLLAALSINLGILNLLPIPLVDGGHLVFLAIEGIRRQPASLRVRQVAAYIGLTFLGILFLVVMKNDVQSLFTR